MEDVKKPTKEEQKLAMESYNPLEEMIKHLHTDTPEVEIEETGAKIKVPLAALELLVKILKATAEGKPVAVMPVAAEMTTQAAAEYLNCSRPHLVKLLEDGKIPYTKVGKHRRVMFEDIVQYKKEMKAKQKKSLIDMMRSDEELGMYDT
jgi:excisionase family DNA binding protein